MGLSKEWKSKGEDKKGPTIVSRVREIKGPIARRIIFGLIVLFMIIAPALFFWGKFKGWTYFGSRSSPAAPAFIDSVTGMEFITIKGGCYPMGDIFGDGEDWEKPVHEVCLDDFFLGKYAVTQGQWNTIMGKNPSFFKAGNTYPVENVSWDEVQGFIQKLNQKSGKTYRLPTEAEREYAARSGGKMEKWAGTNRESALIDYSWFEGNSANKSHPVGQKRPNGLGLYDMSGNVWEWVEDVYRSDAYKVHPRTNPLYQGPGPCRVTRGGSWFNKPWGARTTDRGSRQPDTRSYGLGFRLARSK